MGHEDEHPEPPRLAELTITRGGLRELPDPQPLIANTLDQGTVALLYGRWGLGKSFLALDWAACIATGKNWQARPVEQRRVLYVAAEGAFGMKARVAAWETAWRTTVPDDGALDILPMPVNLSAWAQVNELVALTAWNGYSFVVLDTLARCMVGADENSAKDCGLVVDALNQLRQATPDGRGVVLGVHHAGKDGRTLRGSSAFEAGADTVYSVTPDERAIILDREKRKDGPQADRHTLMLDPVAGTDSAVISVHRGGGQTDRADRLMSTFVQHFAETGASKAELRNLAEMPTATFHRALSDLLKSGDLVDTGTEKRPFYKAVTP